MRYFSVLAGAVRVFGDFVVLVRCGPLFLNFLVGGAVRVSFWAIQRVYDHG